MSNSYINILKQNNIYPDVLKNKSIFPCYKISKSAGIIIKFDTETSGYLIFDGDNDFYEVGKHSKSWTNINNKQVWRDLTNEEYNKYVNKCGWITNE